MLFRHGQAVFLVRRQADRFTKQSAAKPDAGADSGATRRKNRIVENTVENVENFVPRRVKHRKKRVVTLFFSGGKPLEKILHTAAEKKRQPHFCYIATKMAFGAKSTDPPRAFAEKRETLYKCKGVCFTYILPIKRRFTRRCSRSFSLSLRRKASNARPYVITNTFWPHRRGGHRPPFIIHHPTLFSLHSSLFTAPRHRNRPLPFKNTCCRAEVQWFIRSSCDLKPAIKNAPPNGEAFWFWFCLLEP